MIGELSPFHAAFGYYADGANDKTSVFPDGWQNRRIPVQTKTLRDVTIRGWCPETHDLAVAKIIAGRLKDIEHCRALVTLGFVRREKLVERIAATRMPTAKAKLAAITMEIIFREKD